MDEISQKLLEMRNAILDEMEHEAERAASSVTHDIGDTIDHASEERDREYYELLKERERKKLDQINQALQKINNKTYGFCEECGKKISKRRLLALPFSTLCIQCKEEEEKIQGRSPFRDAGMLPGNISSMIDYEPEN